MRRELPAFSPILRSFPDFCGGVLCYDGKKANEKEDESWIMK